MTSVEVADTRAGRLSRQSYENMIVSECEAFGIVPKFGMGSKHPFATWTTGDGGVKRFCYSGTPGDHWGILNARADLRKVLTGDTVAPVLVREGTVVMVREGMARCSSLDIAERFGKAHKDVLRAIDRIIEDSGPEFAGRNFALSSFVDSSGRTLRAFDLTRDGFSMVAMGFTGSAAMQWKIKFLSAFNEMERQLTALPEAKLQGQIDKLSADLLAATELIFEMSSRVAPPAETIIITKVKQPWASARMQARRAMRRKAA